MLKKNVDRQLKKYGRYRCMSCSQKESGKNSASGKKAWQNPDFVERQKNQVVSSDTRLKLSAATKASWLKDESRAAMLNGIKKSAKSQATAEKRAVALSARPRTSSFNRSVGVYLAACGKTATPEAVFGPWVFDFYLPDDKLLIEVQGEYFHSQPVAANRDLLKKNYIALHHPDLSLVYVNGIDLVKGRLREALGFKPALIEFSFESLAISEITKSYAHEFLTAFHYLGGFRGPIRFGIYCGSVLIGVALFGPFQRDEQAKKWAGSVELTRFCIHPSYQVKNVASWFLSRCLKKVGKTVVSYSDTTTHLGTIYKACNFSLSHETRPDYFYFDGEKRVHKKTVWERAKANHQTESSYAEKHSLSKVMGGKKLCFVYHQR